MLEIREAIPEDAEQFITYLKRIGKETNNLTFGEEGLPLTVESEKAFIQSNRDDPKSIILVAYMDGEMVGDASLSPFPRRMGHRAELGISVVKDAWNQGIGSLFMEKLLEHAKANGIEIINLEVRSDNYNAIHLYEKYGFKRIGTSPAFFKIEDEYIDFEIMYCDLR